MTDTEDRQARLWEDTIVVALRDLQWIRAFKLSEGAFAIPPRFLKLDGNAESRIGDTAYVADERYFIFEVKSGAAQIKDEWWRKKKFNPKQVYRRLKTLVEALNASADSKTATAIDTFSQSFEMLQISARGHHLVYWSDTESRAGGTISMVPYIEGVALSTSKDRRASGNVFPRIDIGGPVTLAYGKRAILAETAGIVMLDEPRHMVGEHFVDSHGVHRVETFGALGLNRIEFQNYINFLCAEAEGEAEPINAVVLSADGTFFRVLGSTKQLMMLLEHDFMPDERFVRLRKAQLPGAKGKAVPGLAESPEVFAQTVVAELPRESWRTRRGYS